mgnify:CR=1 FL=1
MMHTVCVLAWLCLCGTRYGTSMYMYIAHMFLGTCIAFKYRRSFEYRTVHTAYVCFAPELYMQVVYTDLFSALPLGLRQQPQTALDALQSQRARGDSGSVRGSGSTGKA